MVAILKSTQKGGGGPTYKALTSRLLISGVPRTKYKMIPLMEDHSDLSGPMDYKVCWCKGQTSNLKAIRPLHTEILHFEDLGDTKMSPTNAVWVLI